MGEKKNLHKEIYVDTKSVLAGEGSGALSDVEKKLLNLNFQAVTNQDWPPAIPNKADAIKFAQLMAFNGGVVSLRVLEKNGLNRSEIVAWLKKTRRLIGGGPEPETAGFLATNAGYFLLYVRDGDNHCWVDPKLLLIDDECHATLTGEALRVVGRLPPGSIKPFAARPKIKETPVFCFAGETPTPPTLADGAEVQTISQVAANAKTTIKEKRELLREMDKLEIPRPAQQPLRTQLQIDIEFRSAARVCGQCRVGFCEKRCARCKSVWYCGIECQKAHWKTHKGACGKQAETSANPK